MPFPYYAKLSKKQQAIYRASAAIESVDVPRPQELAAAVGAIADSLARENRRDLTLAVRELCDRLTHQLEVSGVTVSVLSARPSDDWGELQGLYELAEDGEPARITVWMRTAQRKQPVAFRTFLRTLLHELLHHLDYELLELKDSLHTEGFFKRESSLFQCLVADSG